MNANGKQGKVAKLLSPMFMKSDETFCVHFWFSASGPNIGTLSIWRAKVSDISKKKRQTQRAQPDSTLKKKEDKSSILLTEEEVASLEKAYFLHSKAKPKPKDDWD